MSNKLGVLLACCVLGCGASGAELPEQLGTASMPLSATAATGSVYRLTGTLDFFDHSGNRVASIQPSPADTALTVALKPGNYTVVLQPGWILQRQVDGGWVDMHAKITALPLGEFWIHPTETTSLHYAFAAGFTTGTVTDSTPGGFGDNYPGAVGFAEVTMEVDDCGLYVSKISALASFTIDCLGKLDATQYSYSGGTLARNFSTCSTGNATAIASIDGILSLQKDRPDLVASFPKAARDIKVNKSYSSECIAGAWEKWRAGFAASATNVCPTWQQVGQINPPEVGVPAVIAAGLPVAVRDRKNKVDLLPATPLNLVDMQKLGIEYQVSFPAGSPAPTCGTAAQCAATCAAGFKGFVISTNGVDKVVADPAYWEYSNSYPKATNPFLKTSYFHAMADYGPVPGDQFGHAQRARAYQDAKGVWIGEACSYYLSGTRFSTRLLYNSNTTGAVSWCKPPL